ncbi:MAG: transporter substrate-binding domain-containing protein [Gammaproteobacteria bacterium]|nr:transporter substrate-binding domain-containing protein [Gammaproteobacteria bacterium]
MVALVAALVALPALPAFSQTNTVQADSAPQIQNSLAGRINDAFIGDLDEIRQRRILRVLVSYNRTNFFHSIRGQRGLEHDLIKAYEKYLNRGPRKERYKTHVVFLARPFNQLFSELKAGHGDLIASGLTITPERAAAFSFTTPYINDIREILVSHHRAPKIHRLEELSGTQIIVVANSSYIIHIERMSQALGQQGLPGIEIIKADSALEAEDLLEMVNAGLFDYTVVDNHIAEVYQKNFPNLTLQQDIVFHYGGKIAWATNKNLPKLIKSLNSFIRSYARPGKLLGNSIYKKYFKSTYWVEKPLSFTELNKTPCLRYYFEKYAEFYDFDWFLIASLAYQESRFRQNLRSSANAYGIMQIKPSTARSKHVNIPNIKDLESNIHAGVRYLAFIRDFYFDKPEYSEEDKINFSLAAYNAGPGRIRGLQRKAEARGLDPYKWYYNVEVLARESIGHETVNYVTQIQKMMIGVRSSFELSQSKLKIKNQHIQDHKDNQPDGYRKAHRFDPEKEESPF